MAMRTGRRHSLAATIAPLSLLLVLLAPAHSAAAAVTPPILTSPPVGALLATFGPLLTWENPLGTTQHQLQVVPAGFDGPGIDLYVGAPESAFQIPPPPEWYGLLPDMTYTWRVRVSDAAGSAPSGDVSWSPWSQGMFRTPKARTESIERRAPRSGEIVNTLNPVLRWANSQTGIFYYEVQVSRDPAFGPDTFLYSEFLHGGLTNPPNTYEVPPQAPFTRSAVYHWRVRPRVQGDGTPLPWGPAGSFLTSESAGPGAPPPPPLEAAPAQPPVLVLHTLLASGNAVTLDGYARPGWPGATIARTTVNWGDTPPEEQVLPAPDDRFHNSSVSDILFPASFGHPKQGSFGIRVTAYQDDGLATTVAVKATVDGTTAVPHPPTLMVQDPVINDRTVTVAGMAALGTAGATIASVRWDWGDGIFEELPFPATHGYKDNGSYRVLVTVKQSNGLQAQKAFLITIPGASAATLTHGLAFASDRDGDREVYTVNPDGSGLTKLTDNQQEDFGPAWSPDGSRIAFVSTRDGNEEIYVMNADGRGQSRLTRVPTSDREPAWSPDGGAIAFTSMRDGSPAIYTMRADGTGARYLSHGRSPAWSGTTEIAYVYCGETTCSLYTMSADGGNKVRLTAREGPPAASPAWSPDGTKIAYELDGGLWTLARSGGRADRIAASEGGTHPAWSPDGTRLAFIRSWTGSPELYSMTLAGTDILRLTYHLATESEPAWGHRSASSALQQKAAEAPARTSAVVWGSR